MRHYIWMMVLCMVCLQMGGTAQAQTKQIEKPSLMTAADLATLPVPEPDYKIPYGRDMDMRGELWLPKGWADLPALPVIMFIHGGCWYQEYDIKHTRFLTRKLADQGFAVWSVEYRRIGHPNGGWPNSFDDIAKAGDYLKTLAAVFKLDIKRFIVSGHSAGGHMALWYANRPPRFKGKDPLIPSAVLAMAPAADLTHMAAQKTCGNAAFKLMGGSPDKYPNRYKHADTALRPVKGIAQTIFIGAHDTVWTPVAQRYINVLEKEKISHTVVKAPMSGHFEMVDPRTSTWPLLLKAFQTLSEKK